MTLAWLPFDASELGVVPDGFEFGVYSHGEPPPGIEQVEFYVSAYDTPLRPAEVLPRMRSLRVLQTQTAGVDSVVRHLPDGVTLCSARGVHDAATAEMAMTLMLSATRRIPRFVDAQREGAWLHDTSGPALADGRVLIVGHGSIGAALERRLAGFECEIVRVARTPRAGVHSVAELPGLLGDADVVVLLVPLTDETRGLAGREFL
ncbi:MAG: NAD(P)-dependent oxidoreductase, partial [Nocardioidaceae bacterium]